MKRKKLLIKAWDNNKVKYIHLAYIPVTLYDEFFSFCGFSSLDLQFKYYLKLKARELFDYSMPLNTVQDVKKFKEIIEKHYRLKLGLEEKPGEGLEVRGFFRDWLCQCMRKTLEQKGG